MKLGMNIILGIASAMLLAACGSIDSAAYMIGGAPHSLSLIRTKTFAWSSEWELALVTAHSPDCQRRHKLQPVSAADFKVELYRSLEGNYIVKQGNNWYVTETKQCRLQQFQAPPREPGDLLGTFEEGDEGIKFVAAAAGKSPSPAPVQAAPAVPATTQATPPVTAPPPASPPPAAAPMTR